MTLGAVASLAALLAACASVLLTLFVLRPMIARARLAERVMHERNLVMDAVLEGDIDPDDAALRNLLGYTQALAYHSKRFGLTEAFALHVAMRSQGIHDPDELVERKSYAHMTPAGRKVMNDADRALQGAVADYLVDGSKAWFVVAPLRVFFRRLSKRAHHPEASVTPGDLAADMRRASRRMDVAEFGRRPLTV